MTKVLRLSDGKVFSSTRGAAMETDKPIERAIYYCCRGYLPSVQGEKYEWFYGDSEDKGLRVYDESYWSRKGKWASRGWVLKWRAMFIKAWLDRTYVRGAWLRTPQISTTTWLHRNRRDWQNTADWWVCPNCGYVRTGMPNFECSHCGDPGDAPWLPGVWRPEGTLLFADEEPL